MTLSAKSQVSGTVFKDFNANGTYQTTGNHIEIGMPGVVVNAVKPDGTALTVTYTGGGSSTNSTGEYAVTGGTLGQIRLEFVLPDSYTYAAKGATGGTTVMFPTVVQTTLNLAVNYPADYCQSSPSLVIPCYIANRPPTGTAETDVLVKFAYSASGTTHGADHVSLADAGKIGSTWGLAYNRESKIIYAASLVKRHVGLKDNNSDGKDDIGAIYSITSTGTASFWLDLATLGVDVGLSQMPNIATRALPTTLLGPSRDADVFPLIGKLGLGDIDISDDNQQLFVVNLFDKKVYTIDIATKTLVGNGVAIPDACSGGTARPFALTYHKGKLYAGAICDALSSQSTSDLKANVYRLDGTNFTNILSFPLNYLKGPAFWDRDHGSVKYGTQWNPWRDVMLPMIGLNYPDPNTGQPQNNPVYPQPILADIEFDVDEAMILTFNDRLGHQTGTLNYSTDASDTKLYSSVVGGDMLRAALVNGSYVLESNGTSGGVTTTGAGNGEGPGTLNGTNTGYTSPAGEFYVGDNSLGYYHGENVQGGTALLPGRKEVAVPVTDPINAFSGGVFWLSNSAGTNNKTYEIFPYSYDNTQFGKSNGLGDLELLCDNPPIEIGNRVWEDTDNDGVQDAGEAGIANVTVTLCDKNGAPISGAVATTDVNGNYFFSSATGTNTTSAIYNLNLAFNTDYILKFPTTSGTKTLTVANVGSNDLLDSDAASDGKVVFTTGYAGENDHSFDVGYGTCSVTAPVVADASRCGSGAVSASIATSCGAGSTLKIFSDSGLTTDVTSSFTVGASTLTSSSISATTTFYALCQVDASCKSTSDTFVLTVAPKPTANANQTSICAGSSVTLTGTSPTSGLWTAQGNNPTGVSLGTTTTGVATVSFATSASGNYNFIYTVLGCSDTVSVTVNAKPNIADGSATICAGESVDLTSKITNYNSYEGQIWTVDTAGGAAVATPTSVKPTGTTTYVLVAQNAAGCKDTANVVVTVNPKPSAGKDTTLVCVNAATNTLATSYTLEPSPAGGSWAQLGTTPATATITGNNVTGMSLAGTYQFIYTTAAGCKDTVAVTVAPCAGCVKPNAGADAAAVCQPTSTAKLTALTAGGTWSPIGSPANPSAASIDANGNITGLNAAGTYRFVYSITSGGQTCTDTAQVVVNSKPNIADGSVTICAGESVNLTSRITNYATYLSPVWTVGTASGTAVATPTSVTPTGTTTYVLVAQNAAGCKDTANVVVTVNPKPSAGKDTTLACVNAQNNTLATSYTLVPSPAGGTWSQLGTTPATATISGNNVTGMTVAGTYQFIYTTAAGCKDTVSVTVAPCAGCVKPNAGSDAASVCQPTSTAKLTALTTGGTWAPIGSPANPSAASIDANGNITGLNAAGTYLFVYSITSGGQTCTDTAQVVVNAKPNIADGSATICAGESVDLTSKITNYATYLSPVWTVGTASGTAVTMPTSVTPIGTTTYVLVAQNAAGCKDTANVVVTVNPKPNAGKDTTLVCVNAATNTLATSYTLVPSPAGGTWAQLGTTPATATISGNNVTGMSLAGTYQFIYTTTAGCKDTVAVTVAPCAGCVKPNAGSDAASVCQPTSTAKLTALTAGGTWAPIGSPANPSAASIDANGNITGLNAAGTYRFVYSITSGGQTCTDTAQVVVNAKPNIADGSATICAGESVDLTSKITNYATYLSPVWTVGTASGTAVTMPTSVTPIGTTTYVLVAQNAAGCKDTANVVVTVNPKPNAGKDTTLVCVNAATNTLATSYTLVPSPAGGSWAQLGTTPATATITGNNVTGMTVAGTYQFIYTTAAGCKDTVAVTVAPCAGCVKPNAGADAAAVCQPTKTAKLTALTAGGTWAPIGSPANPSAASIDANGNITGLNAAGTYRFVYSITSGGQTCTDTAQVVVNAKPNIADGSATICAGELVDLTSKITNYNTYLSPVWTVGTASGTAVATPASVKPTGTTTYVLVAQNAAGCKDTANVVVTVNPKPSAGKDTTLVCSNGNVPSSVQLAATPTGGTWSALTGNPTGATVNTSGLVSVTNATAQGKSFDFIYSVNGCQDTVKVIVPTCPAPCVESTITVNAPVCSADAQTYSFTFTVANQLGIVKVNKGTLSGSNPYTVSGIPSGQNVRITDSLSTICKADTVITGVNCNCNPALPQLLTPSLTACIGDTFPTLKATVVGLATVEWFSQQTGGTVLATGLSFKPSGTVTANTVFYAQARSTDPTCPTAVSTSRVPATINAQSCIDTIDLALKKSINTKIARVGDILTYTIKVWNEWTKNATGVEVVDSIATTVQFVSGSFSPSRGSATISGNVIKWNIGNIAANGDTVTLSYQARATQAGVHLNTAEISKTNEKDRDSTPGNGKGGEDDIDQQCFTVPFDLCPSQKLEVSVPSNLTNVQWFKNGGTAAVATGNVVLFSEVGVYTFTATNQTCPTNGCCPVIIEAGTNCCPVDLCIPYTVKKVRK